jgi:hypothetical protein
MALQDANGNGGAVILPPTPKVITGQSLVHRRLDKRQRAVLAADVSDGLVRFAPSQKQLADIFGVSIPYIELARKLSPGKRQAILRGWDPMSFAAPKTGTSMSVKVINSTLTDDELVKTIRAVGVNRVLEAAVAAEAAE